VYSRVSIKLPSSVDFLSAGANLAAWAHGNPHAFHQTTAPFCCMSSRAASAARGQPRTWLDFCV